MTVCLGANSSSGRFNPQIQFSPIFETWATWLAGGKNLGKALSQFLLSSYLGAWVGVGLRAEGPCRWKESAGGRDCHGLAEGWVSSEVPRKEAG